jgi:tetratricopeptide (TPR) repeat protein
MKKLTFIISIFTALNLNAQTIDDYQQKLSECFSKGDYKCAEENALASIAIADKDFNNLYLLYSNLGTIQRRLGKMDEAMNSYNKACELNCTPSVLANRASLKRQMDDLEGSLEDYNKAIESKPTDEELLINRSVTKKLLGDTIGAENDLILILQFNADNYKAFTNLLNIKVSRGEYQYALDKYNEMISNHPNESLLYNNRADVYLKMKNYDKAFEDINTSIKMAKDYDNAYVTRAEIFMATGNKKKALKDLQQAVKLGNNTTYVFKLIDECNEK